MKRRISKHGNSTPVNGYVASVILFVLLFFAGTACDREAMTAAEAKESAEELVVSDQAMGVATGSIELSTNFTIGAALKDAAEELRAFVKSQLPCAEITKEDATLTIVYGSLPGACTWKGKTYSGTHKITVVSTEPGTLTVDHVWDKFADGVVSVTGSAHVVWTSKEPSRTIDHKLTWTRLSDGRTGTGEGHRVQVPLSGGVAEGILVNGNRKWTSEKGEWELAIDQIEIRWIDPVPQAGSYHLETAFGKSATVSFSRVDEDTIAVTFETGKVHFTFNVTKAGGVAQTQSSGE
jgi:hypothetical protein